ncbi:FxSxx-COOH system tetratricopeptide repeat protein [Amycolatopsis sp. NPDC003865]
MHIHPRVAWAALWPEQAKKPCARRVFLSHTSELGELPKQRSFVEAMESAITRAGDAVADMAYFTTRNVTPEQVDLEKLAEADVYVLLAGFCYGSLAHGRTDMSSTEQEFQTATSAGLPRLVFMLGDETEGPRALFSDPRHGDRQEAFRQRLQGSGIALQTVSTPDQLETALFQALTELARPQQQSMPAGRIWGIPGRTVEFTGREGLLASLHESLQSGRPAVVHAMYGMGGVGKTTMALEYAHRFGDDYDVAWWIPAEDPDLIAGRLADLARTLDLASEQDSANAALARLHGALRTRNHWLLIFDNAEDAKSLQPFLPGGEGHVIITSRNPNWGGVGVALPVNVFTRAESIEVLRTRLAELTGADADRIAEALGDLPLAVDQAGWLLSVTRWTADTYLSLLAERTEELLARHEQTSGYPISVAASWTLSFDRLAHDHPAALLALTCMAWLAPEPVPLTLLTQQLAELPEELASVARDPLAFADLISILRTRGMADVTATTAKLHRVPAALLRARTKHVLTAGSLDWPVVVVRLLRAGLPPVDPWGNPSAWPIWQPLLPHILVATDSERDLQPAISDVAYMLERAAIYLQTRGDPRAALPLFERSYELFRAARGDDHPDTLDTASSLAVDLRALGEYQRAYNLHQDILVRARHALGDDHRITLVTAGNLAFTLRALGEHQRAHDLNEDTLTRFQRVLGNDHAETLATASNLALDLRALGELQRAHDLNQDTLTRRKHILGDNHPYTLISAKNLAVDLRLLGEYQRAHDLNQDTLTRSKRVLGESHPETLATASNLALDLRALGELQRAYDLNRDTLTRRKRILGDNHPDTLATADDVATDSAALGRAEDSHR